MENNDISKITKGDIVVLKDFHTLEATGSEYSAEVCEVNRWQNENFVVYGFEFEIDAETRLMLLVRDIKGTFDYRLFMMWEQSSADNVDSPVLDVSSEDVDFADFDVILDGEKTEYSIKKPYPFWDMDKNDGKQVALCEYLINDDDCDTYWAKNCFVEWYHHNDSEGLMTVWFGWDATQDDFDLLKR